MRNAQAWRPDQSGKQFKTNQMSKGNIITVAIWTDDDECYFIVDDETNLSLLSKKFLNANFINFENDSIVDKKLIKGELYNNDKMHDALIAKLTYNEFINAKPYVY